MAKGAVVCFGGSMALVGYLFVPTPVIGFLALDGGLCGTNVLPAPRFTTIHYNAC